MFITEIYGICNGVRYVFVGRDIYGNYISHTFEGNRCLRKANRYIKYLKRYAFANSMKIRFKFENHGTY